MTLEMFPSCPVAGCTNRVAAQGDPCNECRRAFGPMLRENTDRPPMTAATQRHQRAAAIDAGQQTKPGQTCWLCEQRRTCTLTAGQWECATCVDIT